MSNIGKNIRKIRNLKSLSQQEFGELFGLKRATLGAYEEERSEPKIDTIISIANYFSIPIDDLLTRELTVNEITKFKADVDEISLNSASFIERKIPFVSVTERNNYIENEENVHYLEAMPFLILPSIDYKNTLAFEVGEWASILDMGNYHYHDVVIGKEFDGNNESIVKTGSLFVIQYDFYLTIAILVRSSSQKLLWIKMDPNITLPIEDSKIQKIWKVEKIITSISHEDNERSSALENRVSKLERNIAEINFQLKKEKSRI